MALASTTDLWHYNAMMDNFKHMVTGKEISTAEYERRKREGTLEVNPPQEDRPDSPRGVWKPPLGEDNPEKSKPPYVEYDPRLPMPKMAQAPTPQLPPVRVVPVDRVCEALDQVLTLYRQSPDVERYARHVADKVLAMGTMIQPLVTAEVRDPKELMR